MRPSIRDLYVYALSEGEGVGTAYEYYVKRRVMRSVLDHVAYLGPAARILVAGLPEKYGTSLDFVLAASELGARVLVVDDRDAAIERARGAVDPLVAAGKLPSSVGTNVTYRKLASMGDLASVGAHDVALSCEVIQRLVGEERAKYTRALRDAAPRGVVFVPNGENPSHTKISGLSGLDRTSLRELMGPGLREVGFTDMPPFPPGIRLSNEQRSKASSGTKEAIGMWGLQMFSATEPYLPAMLKRHVAHIVYAKWE